MRIPGTPFHDDSPSLEDQIKHEKRKLEVVLEVVHELLKLTLKNLEKRDLSEVMPHEFFVALGVAEKAEISEEALRLTPGVVARFAMILNLPPSLVPIVTKSCTEEPQHCGGVLAEELDTYFREKPKLLVEARGKFVLIKGRSVIGIFDTFQHAVEEGINRFDVVPMLVRQILDVEPILHL